MRSSVTSPLGSYSAALFLNLISHIKSRRAADFMVQKHLLSLGCSGVGELHQE